MTGWNRLVSCVSRFRSMLARRRLDEEARLELEAHLDMLAERHRQQGLSEQDAYRAARRQFGHAAAVVRDVRDLNTVAWVDHVSQDARYAWRQLRGNPGYAIVVIATLAVGIGATTAVFSVVDAVLLAPLPYSEPGRLVQLHQQRPGQPDTRDVVSGAHFAFIRQHASAFDDVATLAHYAETGLDLSTGGGPVRLRALGVSSSYFSTLGTPLRLGHGFDLSDESGSRRVVLSEQVWRDHFGADEGMLGTTVRLNGEAYEVAGVAGADFSDPVAPDVSVWVPYALAKDTDPENTSLTVIGRLRPGLSLGSANQELAALSAPMRERWPQADKSAVVATPLHEELVARARGPLRLALAAVILVLAVACVNVANLALVRATGRVGEFAVRAALGSGQARLARQLLVESVLLAALGGGLGVAIAAASITGLRGLAQTALPRLDAVALNPGVLAFALILSVCTAIAFGTAPALRLSATAPIEAMRQQSRSATASRGLTRLRGALAAVQVALALALLVGAALLLASFHRLQRVPLGIAVDRSLTFEVNLPTVSYDVSRRAAFHEELADRLEAMPGVTAAGGISRLPATGSYHPWNTHIRSGPLSGTAVDRRQYAMQQRVISGRALQALGIPLLAGRLFEGRDDMQAPARAVVSAHLAHTAFPGLSLDAVLGQRIAVAGREREVIGVVGDVALDVYGRPSMVVYHAHRQFAGNRNWSLTQVAATTRSPGDLITAVREQVRRLDPELVVHRPALLAEIVGRGAGRERFALALMAAFALVAVALAALGLYGMLAHGVRQRSTEIGIRLALGASATCVRALILRQAAVVVTIGLVSGLFASLALSRWLESLLFEVKPGDPTVVLACALLLTAVAALAAWLPAQRATRLDPKAVMQIGQ
jgi:putative ABC transport system permease protein